MERKHTPGLWIIRSRGEGAEPATVEAPEHIVLPHTFTEQTEGMTEVIAFVDAEANARLIAAAPDLLAACEAGLQELTTLAHSFGLENFDSNPAAKQLKAAIAKATGGAQ